MARGTAKKLTTANAGNDVKNLIAQHNKLVDEIDDIRTKYAALLAKLDSNHAAATDHVATLALATEQSVKLHGQGVVS